MRCVAAAAWFPWTWARPARVRWVRPTSKRTWIEAKLCSASVRCVSASTRAPLAWAIRPRMRWTTPTTHKRGFAEKDGEPAMELPEPKLTELLGRLLQPGDCLAGIAFLQIGIAQETQGNGGIERIWRVLQTALACLDPRLPVALSQVFVRGRGRDDLPPGAMEGTEGEPHDGQRQGGPLPPSEHSAVRAVVRGLSLALSAWRSTEGSAWGLGAPREPPALGRAISPAACHRVALLPTAGVGEVAAGGHVYPGQRAVGLPRSGGRYTGPAHRLSAHGTTGQSRCAPLAHKGAPAARRARDASQRGARGQGRGPPALEPGTRPCPRHPSGDIVAE